MIYLLLTLTLLFCSRINALVTVLCNDLLICSGGDYPICTYVQVACVLYDNGQFKLSKYNTYPFTYHSGGFDQNGYHVEYYFGEDYSVSIGTPNGGGVSKMKPASRTPCSMYFAFNDKPLEQGAEDARSACQYMNSHPTLALNCDEVYEEAKKVYVPN